MGRVILIVLALALVVAGLVIVGNGLRAAVRGVDNARGLDMARDGMLPKLAYGLLIALIVYATLTAGGWG